jgi:hypothetical protein
VNERLARGSRSGRRWPSKIHGSRRISALRSSPADWAGGRRPDVCPCTLATLTNGRWIDPLVRMATIAEDPADRRTTLNRRAGVRCLCPGKYGLFSCLLIEIVLTAFFLLIIVGVTAPHVSAGVAAPARRLARLPKLSTLDGINAPATPSGAKHSPLSPHSPGKDGNVGNVSTTTDGNEHHFGMRRRYDCRRQPATTVARGRDCRQLGPPLRRPI